MTGKRLLVAVPLAMVVFLVCNVAQFFWITANWFDYWPYGFPLHFYEVWGPCPPNEICHSFSPSRLLADIGIVYATSLLFVVIIATARKQLSD